MARPLITEHRLGPAQAKQVRLLCPHCSSALYVEIPYGVEPWERRALLGEAIIDHRPQCSGAPPEAGRVYQIDYPRA